MVITSRTCWDVSSGESCAYPGEFSSSPGGDKSGEGSITSTFSAKETLFGPTGFRVSWTIGKESGCTSPEVVPVDGTVKFK